MTEWPAHRKDGLVGHISRSLKEAALRDPQVALEIWSNALKSHFVRKALLLCVSEMVVGQRHSIDVIDEALNWSRNLLVRKAGGHSHLNLFSLTWLTCGVYPKNQNTYRECSVMHSPRMDCPKTHPKASDIQLVGGRSRWGKTLGPLVSARFVNVHWCVKHFWMMLESNLRMQDCASFVF